LELRREFLELATHCGNYRACSFALGDIEEAQKMGLIALTDLLALNQEEASALFGSGSGYLLGEELLAEYAATYTATHPALRMVVNPGPRPVPAMLFLRVLCAHWPRAFHSSCRAMWAKRSLAECCGRRWISAS
jgi:hypothetical protein